MPTRTAGSAYGHDRLTIISMAVIASALATLLHEGVGHGLTAFVRGDVPTELTSNHLSSLHPDRLVQAAGTLVNLAAGAIALLASSRVATRPNLRYFLWILAALNLLPGAGYFLFSGIGNIGDWAAVFRGTAPPIIWLLAVLWFTIFPASTQATIFLILTCPVSGCTCTLAKCAEKEYMEYF